MTCPCPTYRPAALPAWNGLGLLLHQSSALGAFGAWGTTQLTPHITLEALTRSGNADRLGLANTPSLGQNNALRNLSLRTLELLWAVFGGLTFSSGYRSPEVNAVAKGAHESQHMAGEAVDFKPVSGTSTDVAVYLWNHPEIPVDQVILYHPSRGGHVHVSLKINGTQRRQFLYAPQGRTDYVAWTPAGPKLSESKTGEEGSGASWIMYGAIAAAVFVGLRAYRGRL